MFCAKRSQREGSKSSPTKRATALAKSLRHASCVNEDRADPTIRVSFGNRPLRNKWYSAGTSLRCVRSPDAPKITNVCGIVLDRHCRETTIDVNRFARDEATGDR